MFGEPLDLDYGNPLNSASTLNNGLLLWFLATPVGWSSPQVWSFLNNYNLTFEAANVGYGWTAPSHKGGWGSWRFNGSSGWLSGNQFRPSGFTKITAACWANVTNVPSTRAAFFCNAQSAAPSGWDLGQNLSKQPQWLVSDQGTSTNSIIASSSTITANSWHHYCGTWDGTTQLLYVDAVQVASASFSGALFKPTTNVLIGGDNHGGIVVMQGYVNDCRLWNRALSAAEVGYLYCDSQTGNRGTLNYLDYDVLIPGSAPVRAAALGQYVDFLPDIDPSYFE